jgi:two-component system, NarL family, response regulator NreC
MGVRILLVDDHPIVRQGLRTLLEAEADFSVIDEASDGLEALQLIEQWKPDVLVIDLMMPGLTGLEVVRQTKKISPETRMIILSMYSDEAYVLEALKSGAMGYVLKGANPTDLVQGVHEVLAGRRYLSAPLSERAIEVYIQRGKEAIGGDPYDALTTREREVLQLAVNGLTNHGIAAALTISSRTVEIHRANMMHKLGLRHQVDLMRFALRRGLLSTA